MIKRSLFFPVLSLAFVLTSCSYFPTMRMLWQDPHNRDMVANSIVVAKESAPPLQTFRSGREMLDDLIKIGKQVDEKDDGISLPSTAPIIEGRLVKALQDKNIVVGEPRYMNVSEGEKNDWAAWSEKNNIKSGLILDTRIVSWDVTPHRKDRTRFNLNLNAQTRVYNVKKGAIVAQYYCQRGMVFDDLEKAPTKYKLMKDDMKLLKSLMSKLADECADKTVEEIL